MATIDSAQSPRLGLSSAALGHFSGAAILLLAVGPTVAVLGHCTGHSMEFGSNRDRRRLFGICYVELFQRGHSAELLIGCDEHRYQARSSEHKSS